MKSFITNFFEYNHYSNLQMISMIENTPSSYSDRAKTLMGHTFIAQNIWNQRILGNSPKLGVWDVFTIHELRKLNDEYHETSIHILTTTPLETTINYKDSTGALFSNSLTTILFHIVNHSTYHRGQLLTELKSNGAQPISTDYIAFRR